MTDKENTELLNLCNEHINQQNIILNKKKHLNSLESLTESNEYTLLKASDKKYISFAVWKQILLWFVILCIFIIIDNT